MLTSVLLPSLAVSCFCKAAGLLHAASHFPRVRGLAVQEVEACHCRSRRAGFGFRRHERMEFGLHKLLWIPQPKSLSAAINIDIFPRSHSLKSSAEHDSKFCFSNLSEIFVA